MRIPSDIAECGTTRKLFTKIVSLISRAIQSNGGVAMLLTFFVFATWLADCLPVAPFVWIVTPPRQPRRP